jgi:hypothetical protein
MIWYVGWRLYQNVLRLMLSLRPPSSTLQVLSSFGRPLHDGCTLLAAGLCAGSTLDAQLRLRGGGGDGGSTGAESRSSYLEMYAVKKPQKVSGRRCLLCVVGVPEECSTCKTRVRSAFESPPISSQAPSQLAACSDPCCSQAPSPALTHAACLQRRR